MEYCHIIEHFSRRIDVDTVDTHELKLKRWDTRTTDANRPTVHRGGIISN